MRASRITLLLLSYFFQCIFASESHLADPIKSKHVRTENTISSKAPGQNQQSYNLRRQSLTRESIEVSNPAKKSPRVLNEGEGASMGDMNMENLNLEEYMNRPLELFSTPIGEWTTEDWILAIIMFFLLSCILSCLAKIGCGCCNLLNCLTCYCCYALCCGNSDAGAGSYVNADGLC